MGGDGVCAPAIRALRVHQLGACVHWTGTHPKVAPLATARTEDLAVDHAYDDNLGKGQP
jgi:hypothetical protein